MGNEIGFRAVDSSGQTFQKTLRFNARDWQQLEVDLSTWTNAWGGAKDNRPHWPMKAFAVLVENSADSREGVLLIDDFEPLPAGRSRAAAQVGTYDALHDRDWYGRRRGGQRRITTACGRTTSARPSCGRSSRCWATPRRLRLVVDSDGSGHSVSVHLGSHFQGFTREIGKLTEKGEMTLEAPLDDMSSWRYGGGENDGQRRLPLRVLNLGSDAATDRPVAAIRLKRLEIETRYTRSESVVLIPSVRQEGDVAQFSVKLRNLGDKPTSGKLACDIKRLGERVDRKVEDVQVPPAARRRSCGPSPTRSAT